MAIMETRAYTIAYDFGKGIYFATNSERYRKHLHVFAYTVRGYNDNHKLRAYHNSRRVWSACEVNRKAIACAKRTKQVEKWCRATGAKCEKKREVIA